MTSGPLAARSTSGTSGVSAPLTDGLMIDKRAYVHLNKTGERVQERDEPPAEAPTLLGKALEAVGPEMTVEGIAAEMGVGVGDLRGLVGAG